MCGLVFCLTKIKRGCPHKWAFDGSQATVTEKGNVIPINCIN